jgi:hypothetical protein
LLRESGFVSPPPHAEKLVVRAPIESARQLIDLLIDGTVRMSSVIRSRPQDKMALLTKAVERSIKRYREADVLKVPAAAIWLWARGMTSAKGSSFQRSQPQNEWPPRGSRADGH